MVFSVAAETETPPPPPTTMATGKHQPLHNFSMPVLKWGKQRYLRCMNDPSDPASTSPDRRSPPSDAESAERSSPNRSPASFRKPSTPSLLEKSLRPPPPPPLVSSDSGIEEIRAIRAKLMDHLRTAADQMRYKVPDDRDEEESSVLCPWNLRTRRAACKAPAETARSSPPAPPPAPAEYSTRSRLRGSAAAAAAVAQAAEKKEKRKFSIQLSREEVEEDFFAFTGSKPPRGPKKRARIVQRQLDVIFPGLWLSEITPDIYKVPDFPESGKTNQIADVRSVHLCTEKLISPSI